MFNFSATYTDLYQLTMSQAYFLKNRQNDIVTFDYFFRTLPFNNGYAIFAGLEDLISILENLSFNTKDIAYLKQQGFAPEFLNYLASFRFQGTIYACLEGEIVFANCPLIRVSANIVEAQIIETILLNTINFQTLIATKACRMVQAALGREVVDFGLRRAQGLGGYYASRAAIIGGISATSNVQAGVDYNIPICGTMAHSFIQSYATELAAFTDYATIWPNNCVLLVDTYNTLYSGIPNAIKIAKKMEKEGYKLKGIRLDSGDLAYLAKEARKMLDNANLSYVKISVSNQIDEYIIKSLLEQNSPIDIFGVGTKLSTGQPDAALDGIYKLSLVNDRPCIKISDTTAKISLPHKKQVYRMLDEYGNFVGADVISLDSEENIDTMYHLTEILKYYSIKTYEQERLLHKVMQDGLRCSEQNSPLQIAKYTKVRLELLPIEYKRFDNPHLYKVGVSKKLKDIQSQLIKAQFIV